MRHKHLIMLVALWGCGPTEAPKNADTVVIVTPNNANNSNDSNNANNSSTNSQRNNDGGTKRSNDTAPPPTAVEFLQRSREIACDAAFNCPTSANTYLVQYTGRFADIDGCVASHEVVYGAQFNIEGSVAAGTIAYDDTTAAQCLREMQESLCDGSWGRVVGGIESCRDVLVPTRTAGQSCISSYECENSYCDNGLMCGERVCVGYTPCGADSCDTSTEYCDPTLMQCEARKPAGSACNFGQCAPYHACSAAEGGTCEAWGALSQGADCAIDQSCAPGLTCHDDDRICVPVRFGGDGASCGIRGGDYCEPGLSCRVPSGSDTGVCGPPLARGESCRSTAACALSLICDVWADDTCEPERVVGDVCQSGAQCASRSCPGGMGSSADGVCEAVCSP